MKEKFKTLLGVDNMVEAFGVILRALVLMRVVLVPYFVLLIMMSMLYFLVGGNNGYFQGVYNFTVSYFLWGEFFIFEAWRIHTVIFVVCLIESFDFKKYSDGI